jgi:hypothetical protein
MPQIAMPLNDDEWHHQDAHLPVFTTAEHRMSQGHGVVAAFVRLCEVCHL